MIPLPTLRLRFFKPLQTPFTKSPTPAIPEAWLALTNAAISVLRLAQNPAEPLPQAAENFHYSSRKALQIFGFIDEAIKCDPLSLSQFDMGPRHFEFRCASYKISLRSFFIAGTITDFKLCSSLARFGTRIAESGISRRDVGRGVFQ